ncbi:MAG: Ig-like domain-containing protein [Actinomycetota bacterium]
MHRARILGGFLALFVGALLSGLWIAEPRRAPAYPGPGDGYRGWSAEAVIDLPNPRHVQMAHGGGYLYLVADDGADVYLYRATDLNRLDWHLVKQMDVDPRRLACDAYLEAREDCLALSWKELVAGRWALVIAISFDHGDTWRTWVDAGGAWNNYEAHLALAGDVLHAAYVSDYTGRNEVFYRRFNLELTPLSVSCATGAQDGVSATQPCIESSGPLNASIYYVRQSGPPNPVWQALTEDAGLSWIGFEIVPTEGGVDLSWPEVATWRDGSDRRVMVVANGRHLESGNHRIRYSRFYNGVWEKGIEIGYFSTYFSYPQIFSGNKGIFVVFRQSGGSTGLEGGGLLNTHSGEFNSWKHVDDLFFLNLPYDHPGSIDCCSDGERFYAAAAGTGPRAVIMTKREDSVDPAVYLENPGMYHNGDFPVRASAQDDFDRSGDWLLAPQSEHYDRGILHADFYYRPDGTSEWLGWPGGMTDPDAPWEKTFPGGNAPEGRYDLRVVVTDTAMRLSENVFSGVCVDRTPPVAELSVSPPDGDDGWYREQPASRPAVRGSDSLSGIRCAYYRLDDAPSWTVYSTPFDLLEGEHVIRYYVKDRAGNDSPVTEFIYRADFTDPTGSITTPSGGSYFRDAMEVEASCEDSGSGVASLTWLVDGFPRKTVTESRTTLDLSGLPEGWHTLEVEIRDRAGRTFRPQAIDFFRDVTPPTASILEPRGQEWVRGMVPVMAEVGDNLRVAGVSFFVDGKPLAERSEPPWTVSWDTAAVKNGYHTLRVEAWDAAGNRSRPEAASEVTVFVGNNISQTNHFAEGCTRPGFDTWLCIQNPGDEVALVTVNYQLGEGQGAASPQTYQVAAHSRYTIYVNGVVGAGKDVSIQVTSNRPIVSERPMYFTYTGQEGTRLRGGHTAQGADFARREWYFAEGCTRPGFDTWLCLQNPGREEAVVQVEYMLENGAYLGRSYRVPPWSRGTVMVDREVGEGHDVSMRVTSSVPVVAERPVYFLYQGMWDGGHNVMGAGRPETEWYFAEGCTRTGFNQWICLMNPNEQEATARITYLMEDGGRIEREYRLRPRSRFTVNVNNDVARQHDVSTCVTSDLPIVVERPMYFLYASSIDEGSNAMGVNKAGSSWYFAEGCTRNGFEEYLCLMNPGKVEARASLRFMLDDSSQLLRGVTVPPGTRVTVKVNDIVGPGHDVSIEVMSDVPVIAERPIYSLYGGTLPAGDTLSGYTFNP